MWISWGKFVRTGRFRGAGVVVIAALLLGTAVVSATGHAVAVERPAAAADSGAVERDGHRIGSNRYRGAQFGMRLDFAAEILGRAVHHIGCAEYSYIHDNGVWVEESGRDNDRVNAFSTLRSRVAGPMGLRVGQSVAAAETRARDRSLRRLALLAPQPAAPYPSGLGFEARR